MQFWIGNIFFAINSHNSLTGFFYNNLLVLRSCDNPHISWYLHFALLFLFFTEQNKEQTVCAGSVWDISLCLLWLVHITFILKNVVTCSFNPTSASQLSWKWWFITSNWLSWHSYISCVMDKAHKTNRHIWLSSYIHIQINLIYILYIRTVHTNRLLLQDFSDCHEKNTEHFTLQSLCRSTYSGWKLLQDVKTKGKDGHNWKSTCHPSVML